MSKIVLLGDTHFGARGDSSVFLDEMESFYTNIFFPYLLKHDIKTVWQLGDLFDRRKYINFNTLHEVKRFFFRKFDEYGITLNILLGNHDIAFKHVSDVNSPNELLNGINNIVVYQNNTVVHEDGMNLVIVPWINNTNEEETLNMLSSQVGGTVLGHLEFAGFKMSKHVPAQEHGTCSKQFEKFDMVYTGHFHHKSREDNIQYVGTPYELTWSDYDDQKYFHVLETSTGKITPVENTKTIFKKILYNDSTTDYSQFDFEHYKHSIVKLVIIEKHDLESYEEFLKCLNETNLYDLQITDIELLYDEDVADDVELESTLTTLIKHVDYIENTDINKNDVKSLLKELHASAVTLGKE